MDLGAPEIVVILVIVLLLFGPSKLPKLGEGLGTAMRNFRQAMRGEEDPKPTAQAESRAAPALPEPTKPSPEPEAPRKPQDEAVGSGRA